MKKYHSAGGIVVNQKNQIIVVKNTRNSWSLPKGHIEEGEDALTAAKREIYEEAGINELELISQLGRIERIREDLLKTIDIFHFETKQIELSPIDPDLIEARWVSKEEVPLLLNHREDIDFFQKACKKISNLC